MDITKMPAATAAPRTPAAAPAEQGPQSAASAAPILDRADIRPLDVPAALQTGIDRGIDAVTVWRDVPAIVLDAAKEARTLVFSTLSDDQRSPVWLRPEWAGLAPRLDDFAGAGGWHAGT